ncbi:Swr1p complex component Swc5 [Arthroderma uncinatum]|uniref:Swr1p complex component Swc5 n=1 Tax=Arthroderma uncinatum TaxID=74035 RepID=UPI00144A8144|nr:Swr1p complex component Swc5 [Arthroderma uncinatum]KAF3481088.1 Swr1p complex component Swc5 [Arthroderma uncinatum]
MSPASSITGSNAPSAASDHDESKYLSRGRMIHWTRIALSSLSFVLAVVVVSCEGHALNYYKTTARYDKWYLSLWPKQLDLSPSIAIIVCGTILLVFNMAYTTVALLPSPRSRVLLLNYFISFIAFSGFIATVAAVSTSVIAYNPRYSAGGAQLGQTLNSWTCTWGFADGVDADGAKIAPVVNFGRLCRETRASFAIMCVLIVIQFLSCLSVGCGWWLEVEMNKKRRIGATGGFEVEKRHDSVAEGEAPVPVIDTTPQDHAQPYNSEEDSDFDDDNTALAATDGESASEDEDNGEEERGRPRKKRKLSPQRGGADADSDEEFAEPELDSGDEAMIRHAKEKIEKKRRKRAGENANNDDVGSESDFDLDDDDAGGEGGQEEKKALAKTDGATIDVDSIWSQMNNPPIRPPQANEKRDDDTMMASSKSQGMPSKLPQEELITIRRTYKFAGEMITEEKTVPKDSAEAKLYLSTSAAAKKKQKGVDAGAGEDTDSPSNETTVQQLRRPLRRFSRFDPNPPDAIKKSWEKQVAIQASGDSGTTAKGPKLNTVMKSKLDWAAYVDKEGIKDDLDVHSKAKEGYMGRMDFLGRVDAKREEEKRNARMKNAGF